MNNVYIQQLFKWAFGVDCGLFLIFDWLVGGSHLQLIILAVDNTTFHQPQFLKLCNYFRGTVKDAAVYLHTKLFAPVIQALTHQVLKKTLIVSQLQNTVQLCQNRASLICHLQSVKMNAINDHATDEPVTQVEYFFVIEVTDGESFVCRCSKTTAA